MSNMKTVLHRSNDQRIIKVEVTCDYSNAFDYALVAFKCGDRELEILSTSIGGIQGGKIELNGPAKLKTFIEYCSEDGTLECLIGYYNKKELIHYENLSSVFDHQKTIEQFDVATPKLRTAKSSFSNRFSDFKETLIRTKSSWHATIKQQNDVLITFISNGKQSALLSFGEESEEILASDYIFSVDPPVSKLHLPQDFFDKRRNQYSSRCKLGVFELVKPDFVSVSDLYYKLSICSTIPLSEFTSKR